jgi:hypothetical protein
LALALGATVGAAGAPVLRRFGLVAEVPHGGPSGSPASASSSAAARHPPAAHAPGTSYGSDENPRFAPDDDEPRVTDLERLYPDGMWPGRRGAPPKDDAAPRSNARAGHIRAPAMVRETSEVTGRVTGRLAAGERVMVVAERAGWLLVVHQAPSAVTMGWTEASGVTIP